MFPVASPAYETGQPEVSLRFLIVSIVLAGVFVLIFLGAAWLVDLLSVNEAGVVP